jgi:hypothetical protein
VGTQTAERSPVLGHPEVKIKDIMRKKTEIKIKSVELYIDALIWVAIRGMSPVERRRFWRQVEARLRKTEAHPEWEPRTTITPVFRPAPK